MYECFVWIYIIWCHQSTTTITTMADQCRQRQKLPPCAAHKALRPAPSSSIDGRRSPKQADIIFKGLRGCTALKTLRCYGDASSPKQRSALRAIHPLNTPKIISAYSGGRCPSIWCISTRRNASCGTFPKNISACSGGRRPSIWCISTRRNASCGALGGHFRRWRPWLWWCFVACRSMNHFFWLNHGIVGIARKLLSRARRFLFCTEAKT